MSRIFGWTAVAAVICAGLLAWGRLDGDTQQDLSILNVPLSYGGWLVGLLMGLLLAWLARIEWSTVPERLTVWVRLQRRRLAWAVLGSICAAILLYF